MLHGETGEDGAIREVLAVLLPSQHPGLVVDAGTVEVDRVHRDADQLAEVVNGPEDGVAQPQRLQLRVAHGEQFEGVIDLSLSNLRWLRHCHLREPRWEV